MDPLLFTLAVLAASLLAGLLGSLLGIGGGMILVPFLTIVMHVDIRLAIGASLISVIATSSGAAIAYLKDRITNVRVGMFLEVGTTTGALVGATIAGFAPASVLAMVFGVVLSYSAYQMLQARHQETPPLVSSPAAERLRLASSYYDPALKQHVEYGVSGVWPSLGVMWIAGALSGLLGIGSGVFKVLAMDLFMKLPLKVSSTTSNFMIGVTGAASAGVYFFRGDIQPYLAAPVAIGVLAGSMLGAKLLVRMKSTRLRQIFVVVVAFAALQMIWRGVSGLWGGWHG
ncbi:sulfite exporter TauE/SafE family protein [bacterium]|nr:sulfite exporter TauE/SafE family protein [bacterium]